MPEEAPGRCSPHDSRFSAILALIQRSFAYMEGRIDPPSSMHRLSLETMTEHCKTGEIWAYGNPLRACVFLSEKQGRLYIGKLAVDAEARHQGLARKMIDLAQTRAQARGLCELELEVRIELVENHQAFTKLGFVKVAETAHKGYKRPTSIVMRKRL